MLLRTEQGDYVLLGLRYGVPGGAEPGRVATDAPGTLYDASAAGGDSVMELTVSIVAVHARAELAARIQVVVNRGADGAARGAECWWRALQDRERLADDEPGLRVRRQRAVPVPLAPGRSRHPPPPSRRPLDRFRRSPRAHRRTRRPTTSPSRSAPKPTNPSLDSLSEITKLPNSREGASTGSCVGWRSTRTRHRRCARKCRRPA
jgi:hypothetical protein